MGTFLWLATQAGAELAEVAEEHGFGLNFDILETNLINLAIIIFVLVYFGRNFLGGILTERRSRIEEAIRSAEERQRKAAAALEEQNQKLAQAQAEAERIKQQAQESAKKVREEILAQAAQDVERMRQSAAQEESSNQEKVLGELCQRAAALGVEQVEAHLKTNLSDSTQHQLVDRSIALLGGR